jgi:hypothetical protein
LNKIITNGACHKFIQEIRLPEFRMDRLGNQAKMSVLVIMNPDFLSKVA